MKPADILGTCRIMKSGIVLLLFLSFDVSAQTDIDLGRAYLDKQQYQSAVDHFRDAVGQRDQDPLLHHYLAVSLYKAGAVKDSLDAFEKAYDLDSKNSFFAAQLAHGYRLVTTSGELGMLRAMGAARNWVKMHRVAYDLDKQDPVLLMDLTRALLELPGIIGGDSDEGKQLLVRLNDMDPARGLFIQARLEGLAGNAALAERKYREALDVARDDIIRGELYFNMAEHYCALEQYQPCIEMIEQYLPLEHPWDRTELHQAYQLMARAYAGLADPVQSRKYYELALQNTNVGEYRENIREAVDEL